MAGQRVGNIFDRSIGYIASGPLRVAIFGQIIPCVLVVWDMRNSILPSAQVEEFADELIKA